MNKKIIVIISFILFIVIAITIIVTRLIQIKVGPSQINSTTFNKNSSFNLHTGTVSPTNRPQHSIKGFVPISTADFAVYYSSESQKYIIDKFSPEANKKIYDWALKNNIVDLLNNSEVFLIHDTIVPKPSFSPLIYSSTSAQTPEDKKYSVKVQLLNDFFKLFLNPKNISIDFSKQPTPEIDTSPTLIPSPIPSNQPVLPQNYSYYAQCAEPYRNYPLPGGCTICKAGCGPTTVAMILSSYINASNTPYTVVESYRQKGLSLGCNGSSYDSALAILRQSGLQTTDPIFYNYVTYESVASDLKGYFQNGWTFLALVNNQGYGHYIWITSIDQANHIWAYDSYYGSRTSPPIDENRYYPYPKYRIAIGVKKP